jgi:uncharacterized protein YbjQ (UPF0145 family)
VIATQSKVHAQVFHLAGLLRKDMQPLQLLPSSNSNSISSPTQQAALRRLQQRAEHAGVDAVAVIVNGDLQQWESMLRASLAAGMSLDKMPSTAQDQVGKVLLASALSM